jgi:hypothetical protein
MRSIPPPAGYLHVVTEHDAPAVPATAPPTPAQAIAAERIASAANRLSRITGRSFITAEAKAQASELRREVERLCTELRRAGL